MRDLLDGIYGKKLQDFKELSLSLPLYLRDDRTFYEASVYGCSFVIVFINRPQRFNLAVLMKQLSIYRSSVNLPVVYGFTRITSFQRKSLIENDIPFVALNGQVYLPFLGAYFEKCAKSEQVVKERFSPTTQMLFLLFLYEGNSYTKSEAASRLKINPMSITRASRQLMDLDLIIEDKSGNEVLMTVNNLNKLQFYDLGKASLIDPVQSNLYVTEEDMLFDVPEAGEFSLSKRTDLGYSEFTEYAIYKNNPLLKDVVIIDSDLYSSSNLIRLQKWKYDPLLFSQNDMVDPVSLICTLRDTSDERIHKSIEQLEEEIWEWQITPY
ncbi:MAG: hypothetical protein IJ757_05275 [Clostridiales bacterium]|nr:hypothetical protein [Clostridiales bacterium]